MSPRRHRQVGATNEGGSRSLVIGLFFVVVFAPLVVILAWGLPGEVMTRRFGIPMVDMEFTTGLSPPIEDGEVDVDAFFGGLFRDFIVFVIGAGYLVGIVLSVVGGLIVTANVAGERSAASLRELVGSILRRRVVQGLFVVYVVAGAGLVYPVVLRALTEALFAVAVAAPVVGLLVGGVLWLRDSDRLVVRIVGVYPLAVACPVLPVVALGVVSPTLQPAIWGISNEIAVFVLDTVLGGGALATWLRRQFDLGGLNLVLLWGGLLVVAGSLLGVLVEGGRRVRG